MMETLTHLAQVMSVGRPSAKHSHKISRGKMADYLRANIRGIKTCAIPENSVRFSLNRLVITKYRQEHMPNPNRLRSGYTICY
jgi:hypothetical protein